RRAAKAPYCLIRSALEGQALTVARTRSSSALAGSMTNLPFSTRKTCGKLFTQLPEWMQTLGSQVTSSAIVPTSRNFAGCPRIAPPRAHASTDRGFPFPTHLPSAASTRPGACADRGALLSECAKIAGRASRPGGSGRRQRAMDAQSGTPQNQVIAALAYVLGLVTGIVFLYLEPYDRDDYVRFHARQSIAFSVAWLVINVIFGVFIAVLPYSL